MTATDIEHHLTPAAAINRFDLVNEFLLILLLAFGPLSFGAVEAWSRLVAFCIVAAMGGVLAAKLVVQRSAARFVWSWAYLPIALFIGVALFQLLPLPASIVKVISPQTVAMKAELLNDAPDAEAVLARPTISFYSYA